MPTNMGLHLAQERTHLSKERTQLAFERTELAFIRTVALFCGLYVLLRKNIKNTLFPKVVIILVNLVLVIRLYFLQNVPHLLHTRILGGILVGSACFILLFLK